MNRQTISTIIFIISLVATAYVWYRYKQYTPLDDKKAEIRSDITTSLSELRRLREIKLDTSIFQDKFFQTLSSPPSLPLQEAIIGRQNPFTPF